MNSNIPANYYCDSKIFEDEQNKIFNKIWYFVGFKSNFEKENSRNI